MTDNQRQAEIQALKQIVEGHKLIIDAMLVNNSAFITLIEASEALNHHKELEERDRRKTNLKVLRVL
ncbi:hypothetical protein MASR1M74_02420 [Lentimicrobium sp.]